MLKLMPLKKLLILNVFLIGLGFGLLFLTTVSFQFFQGPQVPVLRDNVKVGSLNLSGLTLTEASAQLKELGDTETLVSFPHRVRQITYSEMGVTFDYNVLTDYLQKCPRRNIFCREKEIPIPLAERILSVDGGKFNKFVKELSEESQIFLQGPQVSFEELSFQARDVSGVVAIDDLALKAQLKPEAIFAGKELSIKTQVDYPQGYEGQRQKTEQLVSQAVATSLLIKYGRQPIYIPVETLRSFVEVSSAGGPAIAKVSKSAIEVYLTTLEKDYDVDITLEKKYAVLSIAHALLYRVGGESPYTAVILPLKGEPNTDGSYAKKYLEVDKSQQRMYAFVDGVVVDTYIVGTGLTWETPAGDFQILRKDRMAISYSGNWFMPYYMPLGLINGGYYFGFHEIPYKIDGNGNIAMRNVNTMGSPATGGCIQLYREDVVHLFEWTDVGMPVVIYE